jgi:hypothetical protein
MTDSTRRIMPGGGLKLPGGMPVVIAVKCHRISPVSIRVHPVIADLARRLRLTL